MNSLLLQHFYEDFQNYIVSPHMREKLYTSIEKTSIYKEPKFTSVQLHYTILNMKSSKLIFLMYLYTIEKVESSFFKYQFVIPMRVGMKAEITPLQNLVVVLTLQGNRMFRFMHNFIFYSYKKYQQYIFACSISENKFDADSSADSFMLNKFLFFYNICEMSDYEWVASNILDADFCLQVIFYTNYSNYYIARLLISHYGIDYLN